MNKIKRNDLYLDDDYLTYSNYFSSMCITYNKRIFLSLFYFAIE